MSLFAVNQWSGKSYFCQDLLLVREKLGKIYLCQGKPGNVREIVPISENVREIWGKIYYWFVMK